jgi:6-phosphofructokinase 1
MSTSFEVPSRPQTNIRRVAILFAGGPAPAANAVISTAAVSFLRNGIEVVGILYGYSGLIDYSPENPLAEDKHYIRITHSRLKRARNSQGIMIGTARTNPGASVRARPTWTIPSCRLRCGACTRRSARSTSMR